MSVRLVLAILFTLQPPVTAAPSIAGVFEGRTPCGPIATGFTGFPSAGCEKIKWELTLRADAGPDRGTYEHRGTRSSHSGTWRMQRSAGPDKPWTILRLQAAEDPAKTLALLPVDDSVLILLDGDLKVLVGDASWSYALNRTDKRR